MSDVVSVEEGNRRLLVLADFLEKLPPERFDFSRWVGDKWGGKPDLSCGTTACGMGWATTAVPEAKLELRRHSSSVAYGSHGFAYVCHESWPYEPAWESVVHAGELAFALTEGDVEHLFTPCDHEDDEHEDGEEYEDCDMLNEDATAAEVAAHIRRFVAERSRE